MSIIETLTEGMVHRNMQQEGDALLNKWSQTGLLEGISTDQGKQTMARLLENQARELLRESSSMGAGDVEGFAAVAFPIVRRVFAGLIANELVSVQPMSLPSGLIFFLDFTFDSSRMGNTAGESIYGTDKTGAGIIDGVNLVGANGAGFSGPLRDGATGYAYASPSGSLKADLPDAVTVKVKIFALDGSVDEVNKKLMDYFLFQFDKEKGNLGSTVWNLFNALTHWSTHIDDTFERENEKTGEITEVSMTRAGSKTHTAQVKREDKVREFMNTEDWGKMLAGVFIIPKGASLQF